MKKIAILLTAYNGEKWIGEQIDSILRQNDVDIHIFVSCDLSTDNTINVLEGYQNKKFSILPYGERFGAAAPNFYRLFRDVDCSEYDFVALSDQDDIWLVDKIISAVNILVNSSYVGYSSNVTAFWENGNKRDLIKATPQREYDYLFEGPGPGCSFVLKSSFFKEFQDYIIDKNTLLMSLDWHDWLLYAFARSNGYPWYIDINSHMLYRQHMNNQLGANSGFKQFKKRVVQILSGYGIDQTIKTIIFLNMLENKFVKSWYVENQINYMRLAFNSSKCRRRIKDRFIFCCSCLLMSLIKLKKR